MSSRERERGSADDRLLALNDDPDVHGILVQLPTAKPVDAHRVLETVAPPRTSTASTIQPRRTACGTPRMVPCTPAGVMRLVDHAGVRSPAQQVDHRLRSQSIGR